MTWALAELVGEVPHAAKYAWSELVRNTLTAHADAFPNAWDGVLSVDDVCAPYYYKSPQVCGNGQSSSYDTQIYHQDAWSLFDADEIAGITPTTSGFTIHPAAPKPTYSVREKQVGLSVAPGLLRGYVRWMSSASLRMKVVVANPRNAVAYVNGKAVSSTAHGSTVTFTLPVRRGGTSDWALRLQ